MAEYQHKLGFYIEAACRPAWLPNLCRSPPTENTLAEPFATVNIINDPNALESNTPREQQTPGIGRLQLHGGGNGIHAGLPAHRGHLGLSPHLDLSLRAQVAMAAILGIAAALRTPEPRTRPALPS